MTKRASALTCRSITSRRRRSGTRCASKPGPSRWGRQTRLRGHRVSCARGRRAGRRPRQTGAADPAPDEAEGTLRASREMTTIETKPMTEEPLILAETDGHVGIIRLNRPKVLNALNPELMTQLAEQMERSTARRRSTSSCSPAARRRGPRGPTSATWPSARPSRCTSATSSPRGIASSGSRSRSWPRSAASRWAAAASS